MNLPSNLKYSKSHEYLNLESPKKGIVGITAYASSELGDVVFVELPEVGTTLQAGEKFGVIESVKSVSDLYIPTSGKIIEVNNDLSDHPEYINEDPYTKGWILKMEVTSDISTDLISSDEYKEFVLSVKH